MIEQFNFFQQIIEYIFFCWSESNSRKICVSLVDCVSTSPIT
jgi:hypothetical protein